MANSPSTLAGVYNAPTPSEQSGFPKSASTESGSRQVFGSRHPCYRAVHSRLSETIPTVSRIGAITPVSCKEGPRRRRPAALRVPPGIGSGAGSCCHGASRDRRPRRPQQSRRPALANPGKIKIRFQPRRKLSPVGSTTRKTAMDALRAMAQATPRNSSQNRRLPGIRNSPLGRTIRSMARQPISRAPHGCGAPFCGMPVSGGTGARCRDAEAAT